MSLFLSDYCKEKPYLRLRQSILGNIVSETFKGITRIVGWGLMSLVSILKFDNSFENFENNWLGSHEPGGHFEF